MSRPAARACKTRNWPACNAVLKQRGSLTIRCPTGECVHSPRGGIDEQTLDIRAAEFTTSDVGEAPMLPDLLDQIPPDQEITGVTAPSHGLQANRCRATDGAFDARKCHEAIAARGAAAIIPPRKSVKPWKPDTPGAIARNEALRVSKRFSRANWRPLSAASCGCACRAMDGAVTIEGAASRQGCTVSNCQASASWCGTSTVRSLRSRLAWSS